MGRLKAVTFVYDGREYHMTASHYNRNKQSFMKATWYRYDRWSGNSYPESAKLWWLSVGDERFYFDKMQRPQEFAQALGDFLYKELQVAVNEKK